jgi:hypothetical protein
MSHGTVCRFGAVSGEPQTVPEKAAAEEVMSEVLCYETPF